MEQVTLVAPDGREYVTASAREINDLTMTMGYKTLSQINDEEDRKSKSKSKSTTKSTDDNNEKSETKDDQPTPAAKDTGHTPSTDA